MHAGLVWVQMDPNVSNVLVLVYLILFPGNTHFYSVNCGYYPQM